MSEKLDRLKALITPRTEAEARADMQLFDEAQEREWLKFERNAETEHEEFLAHINTLTVADIDALIASVPPETDVEKRLRLETPKS